jgi:glucokinase
MGPLRLPSSFPRLIFAKYYFWHMLLAVDVGGTKVLVGLYHPGGPRPELAATKEYATADFASLEDLVRAFLDEFGAPQIDAACAGVAGPVRGLVAELTNAPLVVDLGRVAAALGDCPAALINDLEAMAYSVTVLHPDELSVLQRGEPVLGGNAALIAAGTGLNASHIQNVGGRMIPSPSESGHADFAARTSRELALVAELSRRLGRAQVEAVISGQGIENIGRFTHDTGSIVAACPAMRAQAADRDLAADITATALSRQCSACIEALDMFVSAYGAESGNLALRSMATAGVYIGGGIAPKILPALQNGAFMRAFLNKPPMDDLLATIPVRVILNSGAGLLGASVKAASLLA